MEVGRGQTRNGEGGNGRGGKEKKSGWQVETGAQQKGGVAGEGAEARAKSKRGGAKVGRAGPREPPTNRGQEKQAIANKKMTETSIEPSRTQPVRQTGHTHHTAPTPAVRPVSTNHAASTRTTPCTPDACNKQQTKKKTTKTKPTKNRSNKTGTTAKAATTNPTTKLPATKARIING